MAIVEPAPEDAVAKASGANDPGSVVPVKKPGKKPLIVLAALVAALVMATVWYVVATRDIVSTDDAQIDGDAVTMQAKVAGYITELDVTDNQRVRAGQRLFRIDPRDYLASRDQAEGSLNQAIAQEDDARVSLEMSRVSAPAKLAQAMAQAESAAATRAYAVADLARQTGVDRRSTTQQSIDQASESLRTASATLKNNQSQIVTAKLIPQTIAVAQAQLDQAMAQVEQARAQLKTAALNLSYTTILAPQDGWITQKNLQLGSYVQTGQSAFAIVSPKVWVTANFKESQLGRMRIGQKVKIKIDAYHALCMDGHIDSIQMGTGSRFSAFPAENATGNFIKIVQRVPVKIVIDHGLDPNTPLPLGLSVLPTVALR